MDNTLLLKKAFQASSLSGSDKYLNLTSEPGGAVGLGGWSVYSQALACQHTAVLRFLHQEAYLRQQPVQEARQHGCASDHHQVLREHFPGINGALQGTHATTMTGLTQAAAAIFHPQRRGVGQSG